MNLCRECYGIIGEGVVAEKCEACCNAFDRVEEFAEEIVKKMSEYEFETFNVGSRVWGSLKALQEYLSLKGIEYEVKQRFNLMLAKAIEERTGKRRSLNPDITVLFDLETFTFELQIRPVFIFGRYLKRVRNISQTRWLCGYCNGEGCEVCGFTGKKYVSSVEELIAMPAVRLFKARDAKLHGAGREDVDARMLGTGRPFVLEVIEPRKRFVDLKELEEAINSQKWVAVRDLEYTDAEKVREVKTERHRKTYRAKVVFEEKVERERLIEALESLKGEIRQRTPTRVSHRRADRVRVRRLYDARLIHHTGRVAVVEFEAEAGLYIKELVSGDNGRTRPSLAEKVGVNARVDRLDVIAVS
ncbi:tRNA pseudouridine(54/55) synthase Pus10 [Archaeoglobus sp.]|uniref:tRNA pseudouridine(54/55) synthase Pus10 n=1 Tax=Archaeoglobus sp. TaxID=1872626 RepID=UPI0024AAE922|nr:tRNA pseudouridine(54/55) synthase Pus10 [Archaeoglobus sp.]MDI3497640.1 tRNA pseudouridine synthase 10 [Archaeoglobus sp.]